MQLFDDNEVIRLTKNGNWLSDGEEITHEKTRKAFARGLRREPDGYWITIGSDRKKIEVEDTAWFVLGVDRLHDHVDIRLNDESTEPLNFKSLKLSPGRLTCVLSSGEEAKFLTVSYIDLLKDLEQDDNGYFLRFGSEVVYLSHN